jgi:hypothetical protein
VNRGRRVLVGRELPLETTELERGKRYAQMRTGLCDALQGNDGKMPTPSEIADVEQEPGSGLAANQRLG